jgi:hypothetical protein
MPSLVFRLWVLVLAFLLQVGSWHVEASYQAGVSGGHAPATGDFDVAEDSTEELSAVDDTQGNDILLGGVSNWFTPPEGSPWFPRVVELPKGGPPSDTPFKPPRA